MRRHLVRSVTALASAGLLLGVVLMLGGVFGLFKSTSANPSNSFSTAADYVAPTASSSVIGKTQGGTPGYIRQGGTYFVYAAVTDSGNPASGTATVTSNTSSVTTGATASSLVSGSFSAGGTSYGYRTASLTAKSPLAEGTYSYTLGLADAAGNSRSQSGFSVVVDNTAPTASDIETTNVSGGTNGRPETGDTIVYTFSEPPDPNSIISGWDGSSRTITVRIYNGLVVLGNDFVRLYDSSNTTQLPLGDVDLGRNDYVGGLLGLGENTTFSSSTMSISGNALTVTLGTSGGNVTTAAGNGSMQWSPSTSATDRAGNAMSSTARSEQVGPDKDF